MARRDYGSGRIEERSPGRWRVTVELPADPLTGKRRRRRFTIKGIKREAQRALREAQGERDRGFAGSPADLTVGEWVGSWLRRHHADGHISDVTHARYAVAVEAHIIPAIGAMKLRDLRQEHVAELKTGWITGVGSTSRAPQAPATVKKQLGVLKQALDAALQADLILRNPAAHVKPPPITTDVEKRALSEDEIRELLVAADGTPYAIPIRFALATGVREGELLGLPWRNVDLETGVVHIHQSLSRVGHAKFIEPKSRSRRTLELSPTTVELLRMQRVAQHEHRLRLGQVWTDYELVFPSRVGTP